MWALGVIGAVLIPGGAALAEFPRIKLELVSSDTLDMPVGMATAGDGANRLFVLEQRGRIRIIQNGSVLPTPFLDISSKLVPQRTTGSGQPTFDERGLLGLAFHPDFAKPGAPGEGKFYVFYSAPSPDAPGTPAQPVDCMSVVSEFRVSGENPNMADPGSECVLLTFNKPQFNHNGGQLAFGPDGLLYISVGDGGGADDNEAGHTGGSGSKPTGALGNAQDLTRLLGKILRIDPLGSDGPGGQYGIPADNPFKGQGGGVREEVYAYGLRNPWRFSFDDGPGGAGRLFVADVGQRFYEEINIVEKGGNYGWRAREALHAFDPTTPAPGPFKEPIIEYSHPNAPEGVKIGISVTGGFVYRGSAIPGLRGKYVFGDWSTGFGSPNGHLLGLEQAGSNWQLSVLDVTGGNPIPYFLNSFGEDEFGELYVLGSTRNAPGLPDLVSGQPAGVVFKILAEPPILGYVDDFSSPGTNGWSGTLAAVPNPGTGGVDGPGDGFLHMALGFNANFAVRNTSSHYQGDWIAAGITEVSLFLNDVGDEDGFEIHFLVSDCMQCTTWQYNEGFRPPNGCWKQFRVDLTDSAKWTRTRGTDSLETVLQNVDRITLRHDRAPYVEFPDPISGDLGVDNIMLGFLPVDCPDPFADADRDGDVDQDDFGLFQRCFSGGCDVRLAACACFDRDRDGHVDGTDLEAFGLCLSGPSVLADPDCDG